MRPHKEAIAVLEANARTMGQLIVPRRNTVTREAADINKEKAAAIRETGAALAAAPQPAPAVVAPVERSASQQAWGPGQFAVVATFRYCLGRQTYIVQECADWLLLHWPEIEKPVRNLIQRELDKAFEQDDRARAGEMAGYKPLGWDCDRQQWERVRSMWANVMVNGPL